MLHGTLRKDVLTKTTQLYVILKNDSIYNYFYIFLTGFLKPFQLSGCGYFQFFGYPINGYQLAVAHIDPYPAPSLLVIYL
jgi:hypothetical protein